MIPLAEILLKGRSYEKIDYFSSFLVDFQSIRWRSLFSVE